MTLRLKLSSRYSQKAGQAPGTVVALQETDQPIRIERFRYNGDELEQTTIDDPAEISEASETELIEWIKVTGVHQAELIKSVGTSLQLHPLVTEDIVHTVQRPKLDDYEEYLFVVLKRFVRIDMVLNVEQVSFVLKPGRLISFEEREAAWFQPVVERLHSGKGRIRKRGADYLAYSLIDSIVDSYFVELEHIGDRMERLELRLMDVYDPELVEQIYTTKRELIGLRKSIWPLREVLQRLQREEEPMITPRLIPFLRDVYDHTVHILDLIESYRDVLSGLMDLHLSQAGFRSNEVMRVLTIIATIFMPLTFVAGIYGMNFKHMPELDWRWSYPIVWAALIIAVLGMVAYFRRKQWL